MTMKRNYNVDKQHWCHNVTETSDFKFKNSAYFNQIGKDCYRAFQLSLYYILKCSLLIKISSQQYKKCKVTKSKSNLHIKD